MSVHIEVILDKNKKQKHIIINNDCVRACMCVCVRACMCVRACVYVCVCVRARALHVHLILSLLRSKLSSYYSLFCFPLQPAQQIPFASPSF